MFGRYHRDFDLAAWGGKHEILVIETYAVSIDHSRNDNEVEGWKTQHPNTPTSLREVTQISVPRPRDEAFGYNYVLKPRDWGSRGFRIPFWAGRDS